MTALNVTSSCIVSSDNLRKATLLFDDENSIYSRNTRTKMHNSQNNVMTKHICENNEFEYTSHISIKVTKLKVGNSNYPITPSKHHGNFNRKVLGDISNRKKQHGHILDRIGLCNKKCNLYQTPHRKKDKNSSKFSLKSEKTRKIEPPSSNKIYYRRNKNIIDNTLTCTNTSSTLNSVKYEKVKNKINTITDKMSSINDFKVYHEFIDGIKEKNNNIMKDIDQITFIKNTPNPDFPKLSIRKSKYTHVNRKDLSEAKDKNKLDDIELSAGRTWVQEQNYLQNKNDILDYPDDNDYTFLKNGYDNDKEFYKNEKNKWKQVNDKDDEEIFTEYIQYQEKCKKEWKQGDSDISSLLESLEEITDHFDINGNEYWHNDDDLVHTMDTPPLSPLWESSFCQEII